MKKTLVASAVAAAIVSSNTLAMDQADRIILDRVGNEPGMYGNIQLAYGYTSTEIGDAGEITDNDFFDNGSTLGFKHSHEVAPGLEAFMKIELEFEADAKETSNGIDVLDEAYIGLAGSFGYVAVGSDDTVYEWVNPLDFTEASNFTGEIAKNQEGDQVQYATPEIAGGLKLGVSAPIVNGTPYAAEFAGMYSVDMFEVALAYSMGSTVDGVETGDSIGLAGTFNIGDLALIGQYETKSSDSTDAGDVAGTEVDLYGLAAIYALGSTQLALGYLDKSYDTDVDEDLIFVQALHNLSDQFYMYVEYENGTLNVDDGNADVENLYVGAAYVF